MLDNNTIIIRKQGKKTYVKGNYIRHSFSKTGGMLFKTEDGRLLTRAIIGTNCSKWNEVRFDDFDRTPKIHLYDYANSYDRKIKFYR